MKACVTQARWGAAVWIALGLASGTGCIPIYTSVVEVNPTVGEKLSAIGPVSTTTDADVLLVRQQLLNAPASLDSVIDTCRRDTDVLPGYSVFDPGFYAPLNVERADLRRAHAAGLLTDAELAELLANLDRQGERGVVRRSFELGGWAAAYSVYHVGFGSDGYQSYSVTNRANAAGTWLSLRCYQVREQRRAASPSAASQSPYGSPLDWGTHRGRTYYARLFMAPMPPPTPAPTPAH